MADKPETDDLYESYRVEAECKFLEDLFDWQQSLAIKASEIHAKRPDPTTSLIDEWAELWKPGAEPKPLPADPRVPAESIAGLTTLCTDFLKADTLAHLGFLRRHGVPQSRCAGEVEQHARIAIEEVRRRKWDHAVEFAGAGFDTAQLHEAWVDVEREIAAFLRDDLALEIWFPDSEANAQAAALAVNAETETMATVCREVDDDVPASGESTAATARQAWMNQRHPGWGLLEWQERTKQVRNADLDYKTLKKYWDGRTDIRARYIRARLARVEGVEFSTVPE